MGAAHEAMTDGGLKVEDLDAKRFGVLIGSGVGGLEAIETSCRRAQQPSSRRIAPPPHAVHRSSDTSSCFPARADAHLPATDCSLIRVLNDKGAKRITPFLLPSIIGNTAGAQVAIALGAKGPNFGIVRAPPAPQHPTDPTPCTTAVIKRRFALRR